MNIYDFFSPSILRSPRDDMGCDWFCDNCNALMNYQNGFTTLSGVWNCSACNYLNDVSKDNILQYGTKPATENQMRYISKIEELLDITFYGTTFEEASDFIDYNKDLYQAKLHTPFKYR
jgi:DNA-directed RNA polymerase subunit M/transcription elongation factor TFIIS